MRETDRRYQARMFGISSIRCLRSTTSKITRLGRCTLADDIGQACAVLKEKGGLHEHDRKRAKVGTGY